MEHHEQYDAKNECQGDAGGKRHQCSAEPGSSIGGGVVVNLKIAVDKIGIAASGEAFAVFANLAEYRIR